MHPSDCLPRLQLYCSKLKDSSEESQIRNRTVPLIISYIEKSKKLFQNNEGFRKSVFSLLKAKSAQVPDHNILLVVNHLIRTDREFMKLATRDSSDLQDMYMSAFGACYINKYSRAIRDLKIIYKVWSCLLGEKRTKGIKDIAQSKYGVNLDQLKEEDAEEFDQFLKKLQGISQTTKKLMGQVSQGAEEYDQNTSSFNKFS